MPSLLASNKLVACQDGIEIIIKKMRIRLCALAAIYTVLRIYRSVSHAWRVWFNYYYFLFSSVACLCVCIFSKVVKSTHPGNVIHEFKDQSIDDRFSAPRTGARNSN